MDTNKSNAVINEVYIKENIIIVITIIIIITEEEERIGR